MPNKLFIDSHCHFFSVQHIPLTQTIQRVQKKLFGSRIKGAATGTVLTVASPLFPFAGMMAKDLIDKLIPFIRFFDTEASYSIKEALLSMQTIPDMDIEDRLKIFTPLVMDFEMCVDYKLLKDQVADLKENINDIDDMLVQNKCLILPFLGVDFRRFKKTSPDNVAARLDNIVSDNLEDGIKSFTKETVSTDAANGDFIGIKLYPSLGGDLWPSEQISNHKLQRERNIALVNALAEKQFPVTTHCQTDSYECGNSSIKDETLINYAKPKKWVELLSHSDADDIRLNLAHFGGEAGVSKMLMWEEEDDNDFDDVLGHHGPTVRASWTYWIITLLKTYKNIYSDIGAFDFEDEKASASLLWLIHLDDIGKLGIDGEYKLADKLMWGTDIPMTLFDNENYADQFSKFYKYTNLKSLTADVGFLFELPPVDSIVVSDHDALLEKLVSTNPAKFMFGA